MGSFRHKINNNKKKKQENVVLNELVELKKKMKDQYAAGEYVEAMDTMAEIARHKKMDPEIMAMGASCYFMTGDYERAAKWVDSTLTYAPNNISARLLLGRLCFVEDKAQEGFAVLSFVVEKLQSGMQDEDKEKLMDMLGYCHDNMGDMLDQHPLLADYFKEHYVAPSVPTEATGSNSIQDMLEASLSPKEEAPNKEESKTKAQAAVDRLKSLLHKSKGNKAEQTGEKITEASAPAVKPVTSPTGATGESAASVAQIIDKVMASDISLRDKIKGLNNFASGLYLNDDYDGAFKLLQKALEIDALDPFVLRNVAYVCLAMKDKEKALEYASKLPMMDFGLIKAIKGHCHG